MELRDAPGWRRLAAFGCDYWLLAGYIALLTAASFAARRSLGIDVGPPATLRGRLIGHAVGMLALTLPRCLLRLVRGGERGDARQAGAGAPRRRAR